jgi:hypothetical protein
MQGVVVECRGAVGGSDGGVSGYMEKSTVVRACLNSDSGERADRRALSPRSMSLDHTCAGSIL